MSALTFPLKSDRHTSRLTSSSSLFTSLCAGLSPRVVDPGDTRFKDDLELSRLCLPRSLVGVEISDTSPGLVTPLLGGGT